ncbi:MAG: MFS transporter, partial [Chloroflexota bacterium]
MTKKQLGALFICNLVPYIVGSSLLALLPIYLSNDLGASTTLTGMLLAFAFALLVISTAISARLARFFGLYRDIMTICCLICIPALWLAGQVGHPIVFIGLLSLEWFFSGIVITLAHIVAAFDTASDKRDTTFGLLVTVSPLSAIIGG